MTPATVQKQDLIDFVVNEARLLDEKKYKQWNTLFSDDAYYWVPLTPGQTDPLNESSHLYEDKLLRDIRIARLDHKHVASQQPASRSQHVLQQPVVDSMDVDNNRFVLRTPFIYSEYQENQTREHWNADLVFFTGVAWHHLIVTDGELKMTLKRVDLLNSDGPLQALQLFV